jgi:hypothetical protein
MVDEGNVRREESKVVSPSSLCYSISMFRKDNTIKRRSIYLCIVSL